MHYPIAATHSAIKWQRELTKGKRFVNVGVLGRPENDGNTNVWWTLLAWNQTTGLETEFVPQPYDHEHLAKEMQAENLPQEFIETILSGWWTTCLEILPAKERKRGNY